jgi:formylglycine-generating enzyme required for sulfatase activity
MPIINLAPHLLVTAIVLTLTAALHAADPVVANVVSAQRVGTKLVDITFDVSDPDSDTLSMSVEISDDSGTSFVVPGTSLSGDLSVSGTPAVANYTLVWDAGADFNQQYKMNTMVVRVIADDGAAPGPPPAGMVLIPSGPFDMGQTDIATPVHTVTVSAFYLDQFEVSKALWDDVKIYAVANGYSFLNDGSGEGAFHPVHTVNWYDCVKWCNARSEKEGLARVYYTDAGFATVFKTGEGTPPFANWTVNGFRLPTEAEWEKAARGTLVGKNYPWGDTLGRGDANYFSSRDPFDSRGIGTTPVGFYDGAQVPVGVNRANSYGLYDMAGNVFEWCWDWYDASWYNNAGATTADTRGPNTASGFRVLRGGSWLTDDDASYLRCAGRSFAFPVSENSNIGFRSARGL